MTRIRPTRFLSGLAAGALALMAANAALSQSAFSPAITVNDRVITYYEIEQRALLLAIMSTPGDVRAGGQEREAEGIVGHGVGEAVGGGHK